MLHCSRNLRTALLGLSAIFIAFTSLASAATWAPLKNQAPNYAGTMILLSDGTVMVQAGYGGAGWMRLTPDASGSYTNGVWTANPIANMSVARLYYASEILPSGKLFLLGGEYTGSNSDRTDTNTGEIYDPVANSWSPIENYPNQTGCGAATVTSNGNITSGSNVITGLEFTGVLGTGWTVSETGTGIPAGATITSIDSPTQVHISANATATGSRALSFTGQRVGCFGAVASILLNSGSVLAGSLLNTSSYLYNTATNNWTFAANKVYDQSDEEGWAKLPNGKIVNGFDIFYSVGQGHGYAEIYDPIANSWSSISPSDGTSLGTLPELSTSALGYELGPNIRLQDGRTLVIGANNNTALYDPTTNTWAAGPTISGTLKNSVNTAGTSAPFGADDAPGAILPNGHVIFAADAGPAAVTSNGTATSGSEVITGITSTALFQVGWNVTQANGNHNIIPGSTTITSIDSGTQIHISNNALLTTTSSLVFGGTFSAPTQLFDFNPAGAGSISPVSAAINDPVLNSAGSFVTRMLMLPTGQLLFSDSSTQLYIYNPDGAASSTYQPVINNITYSGTPGVFTLTGTQLNGQSAGSAYGDDVQTDENYPIVSLTNAAGNVYYARTTNWSTLGVATGATTTETVTFTLNPSTPAGSYNVVVTGAGIQSAPVAFSTQVQVPQTITFTTNAPASAAYNSSFTVAASAGSGLPVAFTSSGVCTNSGATYTMTSGTGTCTVIANQAGNTNYAAAPQVTETVTATNASQTITFTIPPPASAVYGNSFTVAATASSGLTPVTFSSSGSCSNSGATYTMTSGTGTCTVIANQAGNTTYAAATATLSVSAIKAVLTVTATSFMQPVGTPIPTLTYSFSGFVSPDTSSVVSGTPILATTATSASLPGMYPITITLGTLAAANYTFNLVGGTLTITLPVTIALPVGLGLCVPFPVTLAAPAGPGGAAVTLTSSDPTTVDFYPGLNPIVVIILAGQTSPQRGEIPQVCGVNFGTANVTAAPGVTTTSQTVVVQVTATLSFAYASSTTTAGRQDRLELDLSVPAPAPGGLTVNLSSGNAAVATVPATIVIPANQTSVTVPVTAVATGTTLIHASALPNVPPATTSITVQ